VDIKLICQQLTTKEIADIVHLSSRAVEEYIKKIKDKTDAKNLVGVALYALKNNIVTVEEI
jgi:DNA-binding CsgD family transcriptional regulator